MSLIPGLPQIPFGPIDFGNFEFGTLTAGENFSGILLGIVMFFGLIFTAAAIVLYVLEAIALFAIAKRRGIRNAWLAWVPVGADWILGSLSDQYRYVRKGDVTNRRKVLLWTGLGIVVCSAITEMIPDAPILVSGVDPTVVKGFFVMLLLLFGSINLVLSVFQLVYVFKSLYDIYVSCQPAAAVRWLLLSIFLSFLTPVFLYRCRHLDGGMPPRRQPVQPEPLPEPVVTVSVPQEPETVAEPAEPSENNDLPEE